MKRPKHLRYRSKAHAQRDNPQKRKPVEEKSIEELAADQREHEAQLRLLKAIFAPQLTETKDAANRPHASPKPKKGKP